jgi:hypothetical protein
VLRVTCEKEKIICGQSSISIYKTIRKLLLKFENIIIKSLDTFHIMKTSRRNVGWLGNSISDIPLTSGK